MQCLGLMPHTKKVSDLNPPTGWYFSVCSLPVPLALSRYTVDSFHSPKILVRSIGDSRLGGNMSMTGCLSWCVSHVTAEKSSSGFKTIKIGLGKNTDK